MKFWSSVESEFPSRTEALQKGDSGYCQSGTFGQAGKRSLGSSVSCGCSSDKELITSRNSPLLTRTIKDLVTLKALMKCFFLFCSLKDFYNFYEVVGLKWKVRVCWVEGKGTVCGRERKGVVREELVKKQRQSERSRGGVRWVSIPACFFLLWLLLTWLFCFQAKRNREHWFDDLPRTAFLIFKGDTVFMAACSADRRSISLQRQGTLQGLSLMSLANT